MPLDAPPRFGFDDRFARELPELGEPWHGTPVTEPRLVVLNEVLAGELGLDPAALRSPAGVRVLVGNDPPEGATPIAQAYSGHQFGAFSPRLGDGRALLLGELGVLDGRRDVHLKGSGRTPFARGGDGRAVLGPMLREYLFGEAMHGLGIPTTRGLAVTLTGESVQRERPLPGAVLARVAASHVRVGTFQYAAAHHGPDLVRRLADHTIVRHDPDLADPDANPTDRRYLALLDRVVGRQAELVAQWMLVGFVHGVLNTDNVAISGETIDYGPCAFVDGYDPATVFSSIDHGGRYAFGNQPAVMQWNLARLAETLLPLLAGGDGDEELSAAVDEATEVLRSFGDRYNGHLRAGMRAKLGLAPDDASSDELVDDLLVVMEAQRADYTSTFRYLSGVLRHDAEPVRARFTDPAPLDDWIRRWTTLVARRELPGGAVADAMDATNPVYVPRNHLVEEALAAATEGDHTPFERLLDVLADPFTERPGLDRYARPAPPEFGPYRTFCGT